ncbi:unnamed protein product [Sympodiomycopsis kandeliae]
MSRSPATGETFLVIGGCGFLGYYITSALLNRGETKVHVLDTRPAPQELHLSKATYHTGDITDLDGLKSIFKKIRPNAVFHTASPHPGVPIDVLQKVNVKGTANVVAACQDTDTRKLIFTSSASVVFSGEDLRFADERMPYPDTVFDNYSDTKAQAERVVLQANTPDDEKTGVPSSGLRTVAIRPSGIFGPHDRQGVPGFMNVLVTGKTNFQLGDNTNLFDWTYVENVAHAHLLASDRLEARGYDIRLLGGVHLPVIEASEGKPDRGVPTSESRPDVSGATDYARSIPSTLSKEAREEDLNQRPVVRNKYDQFFHLVHPSIASPGSPLPEFPLTQEYIPVAGEAFFITNGESVGFWDLSKKLWSTASPTYRSTSATQKPWKIPKDWSITLGSTFDWIAGITGKQFELTRMKVVYSVRHRYYNIEKARRVLQYQPLVSLNDGAEKTAQWWVTSTPEGQKFSEQEKQKR